MGLGVCPSDTKEAAVQVAVNAGSEATHLGSPAEWGKFVDEMPKSNPVHGLALQTFKVYNGLPYYRT